MYTAMFDGLRSYYARYPSRRDAPGFYSAMSLSFICGLNLASLFTLGDYLLNANVDRSAGLYEHKLLLLTVGLAIAYLHVLFAKQTGRYTSLDPVESSRWKRYLVIYGGCSFALFVAAISATVIATSGKPW